MWLRNAACSLDIWEDEEQKYRPPPPFFFNLHGILKAVKLQKFCLVKWKRLRVTFWQFAALKSQIPCVFCVDGRAAAPNSVLQITWKKLFTMVLEQSPYITKVLKTFRTSWKVFRYHSNKNQAIYIAICRAGWVKQTTH